ncbi:hypothetical protein SARC_03732 [Sphaeroforma arctica JP610]|uniref:Uncharacterized protein n=1 Tax=Sphaeroforma arctica JP610 TaxID=667725 RepID=A0A0L0G4S9_9EUKA|nr:hypothetical protein SARC_03732 [Sphaeroforma arctica JP610]KNC84045.1 hypothetical protein SARC_03732 [Sphaeroforma arctica JP610]|eukprot:XP_014157947.1 hypothetical protein SARC_03732 [Sphaeroforma arctica JP610]
MTSDDDGLLRFNVFNKPVVLATETDSGSVAGKLWSVSLVLLDYFQKLGPETFADKKILELGAGVGLLSIALSRAGASVTCTDLPSALPMLDENCEKNKNADSGACRVTALGWGVEGFEESGIAQEMQTNGDYDYIICADLCYDESLHDILVETLQRITGPKTVVYLIYIDRMNFDIMLNVKLCEAEDPEGTDKEFRIDMVKDTDYDCLGVEGIHFYKVMYN